MLAAFPEDGPPFGEPITWAGHLHGAGFVCIVLFGMTGIVATAVALRRNVAWRGSRPSPSSPLWPPSSSSLSSLSTKRQPMKSCATSKDMRGLEILNHRDRGARQSLELCAPCLHAGRPRSETQSGVARSATGTTSYSSRSLQHGSVGDLAAMPTVTWPGHVQGRRAWIASVGGSDHVRSDHPPRWGSPGLGLVGSGPSPEVKARFLMSGSDEGRSRHVRAGGPFARSKTGCL